MIPTEMERGGSYTRVSTLIKANQVAARRKHWDGIAFHLFRSLQEKMMLQIKIIHLKSVSTCSNLAVDLMVLKLAYIRKSLDTVKV